MNEEIKSQWIKALEDGNYVPEPKPEDGVCVFEFMSRIDPELWDVLESE